MVTQSKVLSLLAFPETQGGTFPETQAETVLFTFLFRRWCFHLLRHELCYLVQAPVAVSQQGTVAHVTFSPQCHGTLELGVCAFLLPFYTA